MENLKKFGLGALVVVAIGGYVIYQRTTAQAPATKETAPETTSQENETTVPGTNAGYKDGQYQGDVVDALFGPVQVAVTVNGGNIADIQLLAQPNKPGYTSELSGKVLPQLRQEAIAKQSAKVDIVSGATQTSEGFIISLQSALVKAGSTETINMTVTPLKKD